MSTFAAHGGRLSRSRRSLLSSAGSSPTGALAAKARAAGPQGHTASDMFEREASRARRSRQVPRAER
eukprot:2124424-Alexandrium_andersonii.AAC.1